jgi:hypothetical protein
MSERPHHILLPARPGPLLAQPLLSYWSPKHAQGSLRVKSLERTAPAYLLSAHHAIYFAEYIHYQALQRGFTFSILRHCVIYFL